MLGVYGSTVAIMLASLLVGAALLRLLGRTAPTWLSGAVGFAALTVACPLLIRLPGRATLVAVLLAVATIVAILYLWRGEPVPGAGRLVSRRRRTRHRRGERLTPTGSGSPPHLGSAAIVVVIVLAASSLPFLFNQRDGVLGEGI